MKKITSAFFLRQIIRFANGGVIDAQEGGGLSQLTSLQNIILLWSKWMCLKNSLQCGSLNPKTLCCEPSTSTSTSELLISFSPSLLLCLSFSFSSFLKINVFAFFKSYRTARTLPSCGLTEENSLAIANTRTGTKSKQESPVDTLLPGNFRLG